MTLVEARSVTKMWTPSSGLRTVDFDACSGELTVIRGPSGSGKSTLLAILAGLCEPDTGSVTIDGDPPTKMASWREIAIIPQVLALAIELSVRENIEDAAPEVGLAAIDAVLADLDLAVQANRRIDELSMGQRQRVAIARAIAARPRVLLADEPTSHLGRTHVRLCIDGLREAAIAGAVVIVASHDPTIAEHADKMIFLGS